jgi:hypothetical protein
LVDLASLRLADEQGCRGSIELAVTGLGGDALYIEASSTASEPGLQLTGQLGDVMKESAQIALSYVRLHAEQLGVDPAALDRLQHRPAPAHRLALVDNWLRLWHNTIGYSPPPIAPS